MQVILTMFNLALNTKYHLAFLVLQEFGYKPKLETLTSKWCYRRSGQPQLTEIHPLSPGMLALNSFGNLSISCQDISLKK